MTIAKEAILRCALAPSGGFGDDGLLGQAGAHSTEESHQPRKSMAGVMWVDCGRKIAPSMTRLGNEIHEYV